MTATTISGSASMRLDHAADDVVDEAAEVAGDQAEDGAADDRRAASPAARSSGCRARRRARARSTSRPSWSVPNQCVADGRASVDAASWSSGSCGAIVRAEDRAEDPEPRRRRSRDRRRTVVRAQRAGAASRAARAFGLASVGAGSSAGVRRVARSFVAAVADARVEHASRGCRRSASRRGRRSPTTSTPLSSIGKSLFCAAV